MAPKWAPKLSKKIMGPTLRTTLYPLSDGFCSTERRRMAKKQIIFLFTFFPLSKPHLRAETLFILKICQLRLDQQKIERLFS